MFILKKIGIFKPIRGALLPSDIFPWFLLVALFSGCLQTEFGWLEWMKPHGLCSSVTAAPSAGGERWNYNQQHHESCNCSRIQNKIFTVCMCKLDNIHNLCVKLSSFFLSDVFCVTHLLQCHVFSTTTLFIKWWTISCKKILISKHSLYKNPDAS